MRPSYCAIVLSIFGTNIQAQESACPILQQAWQGVLTSHPSILSASAKVQSKQASVDAVKAAQLPRLDAEASYQYTSETASIDIPTPAVAAVMPAGNHNRSELGLTASYNIFSGFSQQSSIAAATLAVNAQNLDYAQTKNNLALQLGLLHISLQSALADARLKVKIVEVRAAHAKLLGILQNEGTATEAQVLAAQADAALAAADTAQASRLVDSLAAEFMNMTGIIYPRDSMSLCVVQPQTLVDPKSLLAEEFATQARSLKKSSEAATGNAYPILTAMAGYRYGNPGLQVLGNEWMGYALAGLQLQWNLFDGFERRATLARYSSDAKSLQFEAERLRKNQMTSLHQLDDERASVNAEIQALQVGVTASRSAHAALVAAQSGGTAIADELRDSDLRTVELDSRISQLQYRLAMIDLRKAWAMGQDIIFSRNQ